ncbi:unnamed protein product, partial [Prorocentrum cordatum]
VCCRNSAGERTAARSAGPRLLVRSAKVVLACLGGKRGGAMDSRETQRLLAWPYRGPGRRDESWGNRRGAKLPQHRHPRDEVGRGPQHCVFLQAGGPRAPPAGGRGGGRLRPRQVVASRAPCGERRVLGFAAELETKTP